MRYFKKFYPKQMLVLTSGRGFKFAATNDPNVGIHQTENPLLIDEFEKAISLGVGGVSEITAQEYEELKKKLPPPKQIEALSPKTFAQVHLAGRRAAAEHAAKPTQLTPSARLVNKPGRLNHNAAAYQPGTVDRP